MRFRKAVTVAAIAAIAVPSTAMASTGGNSGSGVGSTQGGANNTTTQYKSAYTDAFFGPIVCAGTHKIGKNWPGTATSGGRDSFACTSTTGSPLLGVTPGEVFEVVGWTSDYFALLGYKVISPKPAIFTVSPDGMSFSATVLYF